MLYLKLKDLINSIFFFNLFFFFKKNKINDLIRLTNDIELMCEDNFDEAEKEYNRLVPEYNQLVDYLKSVSEKFSLLQQDFNDEQVCFLFIYS